MVLAKPDAVSEQWIYVFQKQARHFLRFAELIMVVLFTSQWAKFGKCSETIPTDAAPATHIIIIIFIGLPE